MSKKDQDADVKFIQSLASVLNESDLAEIRVKRELGENNTIDVRVTRAFAPVATTVAPAPAAIATPAAAAPAPAAPASPTADASDTSGDPANHPGVVSSPMVGTAYLAPEPGAAPFVTVGDTVSEGQTLLIVEAMKTMNNIPAPQAGKVTRILIDDGTPVEFGTPLMIIE
ncbi:MAG: acetyl-CoA carboxylase biotin carboxyl carrier protein [Pseudomonadota bacterium]